MWERDYGHKYDLHHKIGARKIDVHCKLYKLSFVAPLSGSFVVCYDL